MGFKEIKQSFNTVCDEKFPDGVVGTDLIVSYYYMLFGDMAEDYLRELVDNCADGEQLRIMYKHMHIKNVKIEDANAKANFTRYLERYRKNCCLEEKWQDALAEFTSKLNNNPLAFVKEIIQNAGDCTYDDNVTPSFEIQLNDDGSIIVNYNETGMTWQDILALTSVAESNKLNGSKTGDVQLTVGEKGVGFKTVFAASDTVDIVSNGYSFTVCDGGYHVKPFSPSDEEKECFSKTGTTLRLNLKKTESNQSEGSFYTAEQIFDGLRTEYGASDSQSLFMHCPVMFTNHLRSITVSYCSRGEITDSFSIGLKNETIDSDNHTRRFTVSFETATESKSVKCFGIFKDVAITERAFHSRYPKLEMDKPQTRTIEIIAALDEGIETGNLYSYLPADKTIFAPFNIQLPVKLNNNRTRMIFEGDSDLSNTNNGIVLQVNNLCTIEWNSMMVESFKEMLPDFYKALGFENIEPWRYIPSCEHTFRLFDSRTDDYMNQYFIAHGFKDCFKNIPYFRVKGTNEYCDAEHAVMFDGFIHDLNDQAEDKWFELLKLGSEGKRLIEYNAQALENGGIIGLTLFNDYSKDENLCDLFNTMLCECSVQSEQRGILRKYLHDNKNESALFKTLRKNALQLNIFPARVNGEIQFINGDGVWLYSKTFSSPKECFFHFTELPECEFIKIHGIPNSNPPQEITSLLEVLEALGKIKETLPAAEFDMLNDFLQENYAPKSEDVFETCKNILDDNDYSSAYAALVGKVKEENNG